MLLDKVCLFSFSSEGRDLYALNRNSPQDNLTRLFVAIEQNNVPEVRSLLKRTMPLNSIKAYELSPLHLAAQKGNRAVVQLLLSAGCDVNNPDSNHNRPLHYAYAGGNADIIELLKHRKANAHLQNSLGQTPNEYAQYGNYGTLSSSSLTVLLEKALAKKQYEKALELLCKGALVSVTLINQLFLEAIKLGNSEAFHLLLAQGALLNTTDVGNSLLQIALRANNEGAFHYFLQQGLNVNHKGFRLRTPLHDAAFLGNNDFVNCLIRRGADVNAQENDGETPLHAAVRNSHLGAVQLLCENGANVLNEKNSYQTPLDFAVIFGFQKIADYLFGIRQNQIKLRRFDLSFFKKMDIKLGQAIDSNNVNDVKGLNELGETNESRDLAMRTALGRAAHFKALDVMAYLINKGVHLEAKNCMGDTPLAISVHQNHYQAAQILLEAGADVNTTNKRLETPLHTALSNNRNDIAMLLLQFGADIDAQDGKGNTPLYDSVLDKNHENSVPFLLQNGAAVNIKNHEGYTPLHEAVKLGSLDSINKFLSHGADLLARSHEGLTPLDCAFRIGNRAVIDYLISCYSDRGIILCHKDLLFYAILFESVERVNELCTASSLLIDPRNDLTFLKCAILSGNKEKIHCIFQHEKIIIENDEKYREEIKQFTCKNRFSLRNEINQLMKF